MNERSDEGCKRRRRRWNSEHFACPCKNVGLFAHARDRTVIKEGEPPLLSCGNVVIVITEREEEEEEKRPIAKCRSRRNKDPPVGTLGSRESGVGRVPPQLSSSVERAFKGGGEEF